MEFGGVFADAELCRDGFVRQATGKQLQDFCFARGERFVTGRALLVRAIGHRPNLRQQGWVDHGQSCSDRSHGHDEFFGVGILRQIAACCHVVVLRIWLVSAPSTTMPSSGMCERRVSKIA